MRWVVLLSALLNSGCTSQFTLGPASWSAANSAPVIPGMTAVPLPGGGFIEEPTSMLTGQQQQPPPEPPPPAIETLITGLDQAQKVRTLVRQLAR